MGASLPNFSRYHHFSADPRFKALFTAAAARVDLDIETDRLIERLNVHLQNDALPAFLERIECKRDDLFNDVMDIRNTLPRGIADQLSERARRNETAISVYVIYKERVEDKRSARGAATRRDGLALLGRTDGDQAATLGWVWGSGLQIQAQLSLMR